MAHPSHPHHLTPGTAGPVVISHRLAHLPPGSARAAAADRFHAAFHQHLARHLSPHAGSEPTAPSASGRHLFTGTADHAALLAMRTRMPTDILIEPLRPRQLARARSTHWTTLHGAAKPAPAGQGAVFPLRLTLNGRSYVGGTVELGFVPRHPGRTGTATVTGTSDAAGWVAVAYDPRDWVPAMAILDTPADGWGIILLQPQPGQVIAIPPLPMTGRLGWWHGLAGQATWSAGRGTGITVGIIDSGAGPHPALTHIIPAGAFLSGGFSTDPDTVRDAVGHGSHVAGIIGAHPPAGMRGFGGLAPGATLIMATVTRSEEAPIGQGDLALALEALALTHRADLVNISITGGASEIERDAVQLAFAHGTLVLAAAGNAAADALAYPAAYPETVAIGALGLALTVPENSVAAGNIPNNPTSWGMNGLYRATFSNRGPGLLGVAAGNGILSTLPARPGHPAPYGEMSGTSMATPMATGALAARLGADPRYRAIPRDARRSIYARTAFITGLMPVGLSPDQQGGGSIMVETAQ